MPGDDWKSKLKDAWNLYGADVLAGGAGALGGWFLPHLFWNNPSYVNKGASAALLAAISIAGLRGIRDAFKERPKASILDKAKALWSGFTGSNKYTENDPEGMKLMQTTGGNIRDTYTLGRSGLGFVLGGAAGHRAAFNLHNLNVFMHRNPNHWFSRFVTSSGLNPAPPSGWTMRRGLKGSIPGSIIGLIAFPWLAKWESLRRAAGLKALLSR